MSYDPTSPSSFEQSRLADLIAVHQAIAALVQVIDLLIGSIAGVRAETLRAE